MTMQTQRSNCESVRRERGVRADEEQKRKVAEIVIEEAT